MSSASVSTGTSTGSRSTGAAALLDAISAPRCDLPCQAGDADLWFAETPAELEYAKRLCADCPVRVSCLAGALARGEPWGVWGGEIVEKGAVVPRKRPRGRPRKNAVESTSSRQEGAA